VAIITIAHAVSIPVVIFAVVAPVVPRFAAAYRHGDYNAACRKCGEDCQCNEDCFHFLFLLG
jgi:hypothetical protein